MRGYISTIARQRAGLGAGAQFARFSAAALAPDIHHAAYGVAAVQSALRSTQNFDAFYIVDQQVGQDRAAIGSTRIVDSHAVNQHQRLASQRPAHAYAGGLANPAIAYDCQSGRLRQRIGYDHGLRAAQVSCRND